MWTCGDFNIRGVAPGISAQPTPNTPGSRLQQWFSDELLAWGLAAATTSSTHSKGGALYLHITSEKNYTAVVQPITGKLSDHSLSIVKTDIQVEICLPEEPARRRAPMTAFAWKREVKAWEAALSHVEEMSRHIQRIFHRSRTECLF